MTSTINARRIVCELVIAAAICGGAHHFLVGSAKSAIADTQRQITELRAQFSGQSAFGRLSDDQVLDLQRVTAEHVREISIRSAPALDQTLMYERVSALAEITGVRVETLNPITNASGQRPAALPTGVIAGMPAAEASASQTAAHDRPNDQTLGFNITISGSYSDATNFISSLTTSLGYAVVRSVMLNPDETNHGDRVRVTIGAELHAFDTSAVKVAPTAPATIFPKPITDTNAVHVGKATE